MPWAASPHTNGMASSPFTRALKKALALTSRLEQEVGVVLEVLQPGPLGPGQKKLPAELLKQGSEDARRALEAWESTRWQWMKQRMKQAVEKGRQ